MELDDYVDLVAKLKEGGGAGAGKVLRGGALGGLVAGVGAASGTAAGHEKGGGKVLVKGSNVNITHSINEDERTEFTRHINSVCPVVSLQSRCDTNSSLSFGDRCWLEIQTLGIGFLFLLIQCKSSTSAEVMLAFLHPGPTELSISSPKIRWSYPLQTDQ